MADVLGTQRPGRSAGPLRPVQPSGWSAFQRSRKCKMASPARELELLLHRPHARNGEESFARKSTRRKCLSMAVENIPLWAMDVPLFEPPRGAKRPKRGGLAGAGGAHDAASRAEDAGFVR